MLQTLIEGNESGDCIDNDKTCKARWAFQCKLVKYAPLHWLAYWDDKQSIAYLLSLIKSNDHKTLEHFFC